ncbi:MAG: cysteine synthase A [Firmicutes bacterium]|nr:cysteine synthase A [Bacillota bacterium]
MKIYKSVSELVGRTPLLEINRQAGNSCRLLAKLECFNPAGSAKDRVARQMIESAEKRGLIQPGGTIIEPTSGNTGIGLAAMAVPRGYRVILTMPDTMSMERRLLLKAYGAELVLIKGGMAEAVAKAEELAKEIPGSWIAGQFDNPDNPQAHYETTGPEIWEDTEGNVDIFLATVGTGGTLSGTARYLKEKNPNIKVIAVEPAASPLLSGGQAGPHKIQGIGANFIPNNLDRSIYDEVITVSDEDALATSRQLAKMEGILVGISSGAAGWAAMQVAKRPENAGKTLVAVLTDTGERYLSSFAEE